MKKILILTITLFTLLSCSSNDDIILDQVIGKWKVKSVTVNNVSILNACSSQSTIEFKSDNTVTTVAFNDDNSNSNCTSSSKTGNWKFKNGTTYATSIDTNDGSFREITITFSNNNNTFTTSDSQAQGVEAVYTKI